MSQPVSLDMERLKIACGQLGEHFDTVHIFVTRHQDKEDGEEGTVNASWGSGNWFARKGQIGDWILKAEARSRLEAKKDFEADD